MATTGERIRDARKAKGMTQGELAEKIGVKTPAVYKYESGLVVNLKQETIGKLAAALDVSPSWLMCLDNEIPLSPGMIATPQMRTFRWWVLSLAARRRWPSRT